MKDRYILYQKDPTRKIATITLNRPEKLNVPNSRLGHINAYLIEGDRDNGALLVDTGWDTEEAFDSMKKQLAEIGINLGDISQILITHAHPS